VAAHEGVEDEEHRLESGHGVFERKAVLLDVEPEAGLPDDVEVEGGEVYPGAITELLETKADLVLEILGGVEEDPPGSCSRSRHLMGL